MNTLIFDCETSGKADFRSPPEAKHQPRIVQLAAILIDAAGEELAQLNVIIRPDGFTIPEEAAAIHGITTEKALACGISEIAATHVFDQMLAIAKVAVAHNLDFDRHMLSRGSAIRATELRVRGFCTMRAMTPVCKLPGNYGDFKWPKLQEAHKHAFGTEFDGAHDALADVRACARVYRWLMEQKAQVAA